MIYLSNPSRQHAEFWYRDPASGLMVRAEIPSGQQTVIGRSDWTPAHHAAVIEQIERFGGRDAAEAHGTMRRLNGLIYRVDGEISAAEIETAHESDIDERQRRSATQATRAALAADRAIGNLTPRSRGKRVTEVAVEQEGMPGEKPAPDRVTFNLTVDPVDGRSDVAIPV